MKKLQKKAIVFLLSLCKCFVGAIFLFPAVGVTAEEKQVANLSALDLGLSIPPQKKHVLFSIQGSNTLGADLAPLLVEGFFGSLGATDIHRLESKIENESVVVGRYKHGKYKADIRVTVAAHGSSTGFNALLQSQADIAASSRSIKDSEIGSLRLLDKLHREPKEVIVGIDGLAVIVHPDNPIQQLTMVQLQEIYTGKITNWSTVGGVNSKIRVLARDSKSGTYDTFKTLVLKKQALLSVVSRYESNNVLSNAVGSQVDAIGFVGLAFVNSAKAVSIADGESSALFPLELNVATEDYPLSRRLYFYRSSNPIMPNVVDAFLTFVESDKGQKLVKESGFISQKIYALPVSEEYADTESGEFWRRLNLNVRFQKGTSNLDNKAEMDVQRLISFLKGGDQGFDSIRFVGYSNPLGDERQLLALSLLRAQNVRWALRNEGVRNSIQTKGGAPVFVADPESIRREKNRRVEVWVQ